MRERFLFDENTLQLPVFGSEGFRCAKEKIALSSLPGRRWRLADFTELPWDSGHWVGIIAGNKNDFLASKGI